MSTDTDSALRDFLRFTVSDKRSQAAIAVALVTLLVLAASLFQ